MAYRESGMPKIFDASLAKRRFPATDENELMGKGFCVAPGDTRRISARAIGRLSPFSAEHLRL